MMYDVINIRPDLPDWPRDEFSTILADPAWLYKTRGRSQSTKSASAHFKVMTLDQICLLPVRQLAAPHCVLLMWIVDAHLEQGLRVIQSWGFSLKTVAFTWIKTTSRGNPNFGMGHWTRKNVERCYLATRGHPKRLSASVRETIEAPIREYARKPDEQYERIEQLVSGPYLELFARQTRPGWSVWGNETEKFAA